MPTERVGRRLPGHGDDLAEFFGVFDDHDDAFAELGAMEAMRTTAASLYRCNNEGSQLALEGQAAKSSGLAADLQAGSRRFAGVENISSTTSRSWVTLMGTRHGNAPGS